MHKFLRSTQRVNVGQHFPAHTFFSFGHAVRWYSAQAKTAAGGKQMPSGDKKVVDERFKKYSSTLLLPQSTFPMRMKSEDEMQMQMHCRDEAYRLNAVMGPPGREELSLSYTTTNEIQNSAMMSHDNEKVSAPCDGKSRRKQFVLHDGPPYANGDLHVGHAMNKILKDIINRYKILNGFSIHFVPGWDCHGLPIELKVLQNSSKLKGQQVATTTAANNWEPMQIREQAKKFAMETIHKQMKDFKRWGVMGDWDNFYSTMNPSFEAGQLRVFAEMVKHGFIYRGERPVYWSPSSRTALAEAELEYPENHTSPSCTFLFPVNQRTGEHVLVWTTTPWTLVSNECICYHAEIEYSLVEATLSGETCSMWIAKALVEPLFVGKLNTPYRVIKSDLGKHVFPNLTYNDPLHIGATKRFYHGEHVSATQGTGLVHTAPGHGMEDFQVAHVEHGLPVTCPVGDDGHFSAQVRVPELVGKYIFSDGNRVVLDMLRQQKRLVHLEKNYVHKYPYDWRSKQPVIIRTTRQWFAQLKELREPAMRALDEVTMVPSVGRNRLSSFLERRNEWCISRQRVWGVPIPVFYYLDEKTGEENVLATETSIQHVISMVEKHGSDIWWTATVEELIAPEYRNSDRVYRKGTDTLDVWFDSGSSWHNVLHSPAQNELFPADLYLEGSDQHRGWFQSSLLCSVAHTGKAPYRTLVTHGFVLDDKGRKMSKSLGNIISPNSIVLGDAEKKWPAYGADVLRMWVASSDFANDVFIGQAIIEKQVEHVRKLRNTIRFMLGVLSEHLENKGEGETHNIQQLSIKMLNRLQLAKKDQTLSALDQYALHELNQFNRDIHNFYEQYQFYKVHQTVVSFIYDLSSFYLDATKDVLYSSRKDDPARYMVQAVIAQILLSVVKAIAPITCHLVEDVHQYVSNAASSADNERKSSQSTTFFNGTANGEWLPAPLMDNSFKNDELRKIWTTVLQIKYEVYQTIDHGRKEKQWGSSLETQVHLASTREFIRNQLSMLRTADGTLTLEEILEQALMVSQVTIVEQEEEILSVEKPYKVLVSHAHGHKCARCWKYHSLGESLDTCGRCATVLSGTA